MARVITTNVQIYPPVQQVMALDEEIERLKQETGDNKISRSQVIQEAIQEWLEKRKAQRGEA